MLDRNKNKIFVLDTNVALYDFRCIYSFEEHNVVIPITLLEEIDNFKRGNEIINYNAREFTRELDKFIAKEIPSDGIPLGKGKGKLFIETGKPFSKELQESFSEQTADHRILSIGDYLRNKFPKRKVILVTKDINLRVKAKSVGIYSEDYTTDKVQDIATIHKGIEKAGFSFVGKLRRFRFLGKTFNNNWDSSRVVSSD